MNEKTPDVEVAALFEEGLAASRPSERELGELRARLARSQSPAASLAPVERRRRWTSRLVAVGAAAAAALLLVPFAPGAGGLTLEEVQEAMEEADWVRLTFEDGETRWTSPRHQITARIAPDEYRVFIDFASGDRWALFPGTNSVMRDEIEPLDLGSTVWESIVGPLERAANEPLQESDQRSTWSVEEHEVRLGDRDFIRFDSYVKTAFGENELVGRLWADPRSRRPSRIDRRRRRSELDGGELADGESEWVSGIFSFPEEGPRSIFDMGVPRTLPVVAPSTKDIDPKVLAILDAADAARRAFPSTFRVVAWGADPHSEIDVLHWTGQPSLSPYPHGGQRRVFTPVRIRSERYFDLGPGHPANHCADRGGAEAVLDWTRGQAPVSINLWDGQRAYTQNGPMPAAMAGQDPPELTVRASPKGDLLFNDQNWPTEILWPNAFRRRNADSRPLQPEESDPAGCLGVRWMRGETREDYFYDPERDYLCVLHRRSERVGDEWKVVSKERLGGLTQLTTGQWVASTIESTWGSTSRTRHLNITPLGADELPSACFDGEALAAQARAKGWTVGTW